MTPDAGADELPEIGPYLGRLAAATRRFPDPEVGLDEIRLELVSGLFERVGVARDFLLTGDRAGARSALDRPTWLELWRAAAAKATDRTQAAIAARIERAGHRSRYPQRKLAGLLPGPEDRAVLAARIDAAGIPLEERTARIPQGDQWWEGIRQAAVALEDSWEALEEQVRQELATGALTAARVEQWRPSLRPWFVALGLAMVVVTWLGLVLGGQLPRPPWLDPLNDWFWSIPWP